ncbi:MGMT family protein [Streptomyces longwoodensis]
MWTSYGDLAAFLGSGAQAVGNHLANTPAVVNAYRVLTSEGRVSDGFRWSAPQEAGSEDVRARLTADGVRFTATGAADPVQRLTAEDLAALLAGTDDDRADGEDTAQGATAGITPGQETRAERFFRQLAADDSSETVEAVRALFAHWEALGGWIGHGSGHVITSAYLMLGEPGGPGRGIWPMTLYPGGGRGGTAEVVFQYLAAREPFTDRALRAQLLSRLNALDGVDLPEGKLELRPNIRLSLLEKERNRQLLADTLTWFRDRWESRTSS